MTRQWHQVPDIILLWRYIYLTSPEDGTGNGTQGWGEYLKYSVREEIIVLNKAIAGRSARSYTHEGRFAAIAETVKPGDWVVIEFGHNDGGTPNPLDKGRSDCPGESDELCYVQYSGANATLYGSGNLTVHTFNWYMEQAGRNFTSKGANVLISSQTPDNPWETGNFSYAPPRFVQHANDSARAIHAAYVNHFDYTDEFWYKLGREEVDSFFPLDHTHTSPIAADYVSKAFVKGVLCGHDDFKQVIKNQSREVFGQCLRQNN